MAVAIYPGSFDPVTNGHVDIARRAASCFDKLVVAIRDIPPETVLFSTEERVAMAKEAIKDMPNVTVLPYSGDITLFAVTVAADVIVQSLSTISDFETAKQRALVNQQMGQGVDSCFLMTRPQHSFVTTVMVKEVAKLGGDVKGLVPHHVAAKLLHELDEGREIRIQ